MKKILYPVIGAVLVWVYCVIVAMTVKALLGLNPSWKDGTVLFIGMHFLRTAVKFIKD